MLAEARLRSWARGIGLATTEEETARLAAAGLCRWASYVLPGHGVDDLALMGQWAAFVCAVDDVFDEVPMAQTGLSAVELMPQLLSVLTTCRPRTPSESPRAAAASPPVVAALADLWWRTAQSAPEAWRRRFIARYTEFAEASIEEAEARSSGTPLDLRTYLHIRHRSITMLPLFEVSERLCGIVLTDFWRNHKLVRTLRHAAVRAVSYGNDIASAEVERALGQDNIVSVISQEQHCDRSSAYEQAAAHLREQLRLVRATSAELGSGPAGAYAELMTNWVSGSLRWQSETRRFGSAPNKASLVRCLLKETGPWQELPE
ncbi:terpene synthase family protein [Streptomyces ochraceiscleroticus]|uniref:terpene synthase family protein n=1 Tax=Streptomyces ochraceiscleroticus TaxID=47761 RepID=UPI0012FF4AA3|nr:hypothetical protein [Streptomyces ochraceiscleroticus]